MHLVQAGCRNTSRGYSMQNGLDRRLTSITKPKLKADAKPFAAFKHSEAERIRRMRINGQYATLRTILPNLIKMDKASVLAETIRRVRELKKAVEEVEAVCCTVVPGGEDGLSLEYSGGVEEDGQDSGAAGLVFIKVALSLEDRPGLMLELINAVKSVKGAGGVGLIRVVKAEMVTVGGRTKTLLWLQPMPPPASSGSSSGSGDYDGEGVLVMLRRTLRVVLVKK
ncbi:transcription factor bHLH131 [Humulus lupulus]|uniref:transcription factor bHLH131 n=1 Tax=Humulus lupulus TaxID=3486 RepID=UPI002B409FD4|nr:transcription factor bHLH131 [Humulus lupulus]